MIISGGTGSGKTTLINAILKEMMLLGKPEQRFVIIEDTVEIQCEARNALQLRSSDTVDIAVLLRATLRARPDRIIIGEVELILRAVELEPRNGAYLDSLGWIYYRLDRFEEALAPLQSAASLVPNDATILEHMGDLYAALENLPKAHELYRKALAVNDENVEGIRQKLARLESEDL